MKTDKKELEKAQLPRKLCAECCKLPAEPNSLYCKEHQHINEQKQREAFNRAYNAFLQAKR